MFIQTCLHKLSNLIKTKSKTQMFYSDVFTQIKQFD